MVAFLGYREVVLLIFPEFSLLLRILSIVLSLLNSLCPSSQSFPPFYSDILKSQGNHWFPCFVLRLTGHVLCPSLNRFRFPVLRPFLPLVLISLKVYDWLPILEHAEVTPFSIPLLATLLLYLFFLDGAESHSAGLKVFRCYSIFYTSSFWFPEVLPTCAMRGRWFFPLFLLGRLALERDVASLLFLVFLFLFFPFELS